MTEYDTTDPGTVAPAVDPMDAEIRAFGADVLSRIDRIAVALEALADVPGPEHAPDEPEVEVR